MKQKRRVREQREAKEEEIRKKKNGHRARDTKGKKNSRRKLVRREKKGVGWLSSNVGRMRF